MDVVHFLLKEGESMIAVLYGVVVFIATFLGACAGLGGGVIIKPILDFIGAHDVNTIAFYSTTAVFTMALYASGKQVKNHVKFDAWMIMLVAIGAMIGGNFGNALFELLLQMVSASLVKGVQSSLLAGLLVIVLININATHQNLQIKNKAMTFVVGLFLGMISTFLGIGGGPINVAVFVFFFNIDMKKATVYSIATILFSQGSKLMTLAFSGSLLTYDTSMLWVILPIAILGGMLGTWWNQKASESIIRRIFNVTVFCIILLNVWNALVGLQIL